MNNICIRRAEKKDCPRLLELVTELAVYERAPNEVTVTLEHFEETGFGEKPVWWAFVAETSPERSKEEGDQTSPQPLSKGEGQNQIIGFALYYIRYSTWKGARMYLEDIIVTEEWRGKGIGKLLFNCLIEEAREKNWQAISWQVLEWNEPAITFYKKFNASFDPEWVNCSINV
jgi:GNAT superfamily N-acetyltransferase